MDYTIIKTGSQGNCVILGGFVAVDMGVTYKQLKPFEKDIKLVLLTHIHSDHFNPATIRKLHARRPSIRFVCCQWLRQPLLDAGVAERAIDVVTPGDEWYYGVNSGVRVRAQRLWHNVPNCGYHLTFGHFKVFYATDTGTLEGVEAKDYDLYMVEANHTVADMERRFADKQAADVYAYEVNAAQNHLSREQAEDWIYRNIGNKGRYIFLHQHTEKPGGE